VDAFHRNQWRLSPEYALKLLRLLFVKSFHLPDNLPLAGRSVYEKVRLWEIGTLEQPLHSFGSVIVKVEVNMADGSGLEPSLLFLLN
jgi:hypothetical protein